MPKEENVFFFTQRKSDADSLLVALGRVLTCEPLHGDISQNQQERTLAGFREGCFNVLIATDVTASGARNFSQALYYQSRRNFLQFTCS